MRVEHDHSVWIQVVGPPPLIRGHRVIEEGTLVQGVKDGARSNRGDTEGESGGRSLRGLAPPSFR